ncbi:MAG: hypothetical protein HY898_17110 [Deltaproteobacteria bacterium]|nr:hypothetical protein [Deltaproteobacteria bacterium]
MKRVVLMSATVLALACFAGGCGSSSSGEPQSAGGASPDGSVADAPEPEAGTDALADSDAPQAVQGTYGELAFKGPWGAEVTRIVRSPLDPARIFAVASGVLFHSKDGGASWTALAASQYSVHSVIALADGRIFAGTDIDIVVSADDGVTWKAISAGIEPAYGFGVQVKGLAWQPGSPARLWAGLASYKTAAIWYLEDGSTTWSAWTPPPGWEPSPQGQNPAQISDISVQPDPAPGKDFIVATFDRAFSSGGGVYCSRDSGTTFEDCGAALPESPFMRVRLYDGVVLIAGGHVFGSAWAGVYSSKDQAKTWQAFNGGWPNPVANDVIELQDGTYAVGSYSRGLMIAQSLGGSWTPEPELDGQEVSAVFQADNGDLFAGSPVLGFKRRKAGASLWENASTGLAKAPTVDATLDPAKPDRMLASINALNSGMVLQTDTGIDGWGPIASLPHPRYTYLSIGASGRWYVVSDGPTTQSNDGIYASSDQGKTWDFLGPLAGPNMDHQISGILEDAAGATLVATGTTFGQEAAPFIMVSSDAGASWEQAWKGAVQTSAGRAVRTDDGDVFLAVGGAGGGMVHLAKGGTASLLELTELAGGIVDADVCASNPKQMIASGMVDKTGSAVKVLKTTDAGASWKEVPQVAGKNEFVTKLALHPYDCQVVFAVTSGRKVRASKDGGTSWQDMSGPVELSSFEQLRVVRSSAYKGMLLLVGGGGIVAAELGTAPL